MTDSNRTLSASDWESVIKEWEKTGETQPAFCKRKGIRYSSFGYWRTRLNQQQQKKRKAPGFKKAVILTSATAATRIQHSHSNEIAIHIGDKIKLICDISLLQETLVLLKPLLQ